MKAIKKETRFRLNTIQDLIQLGKQDIVSPEHYTEIISKIKPFIGIFLKKYSKTSDMAVIIEKFSNIPRTKTQERPIFLDIDYKLSSENILQTVKTDNQTDNGK
jgi:hypothetical protein